MRYSSVLLFCIGVVSVNGQDDECEQEVVTPTLPTIGTHLPPPYVPVQTNSTIINNNGTTLNFTIPKNATSEENGSFCCKLLDYYVGGKVSYPDSSKYNASIGSYWAVQTESITPTCVFSPVSEADVSAGLTVLSTITKLGEPLGFGCSFAVRSGGHNAWGAAAIENGVTIDLSALNQVTIIGNQSVTSVGPGARWGDVYTKLDAAGLAVAGGRASTVGVGGLILGGGLSYFSPRKGFVCDTVVNFQVVLATGQIVNANASSNPDLYTALKGGSNNFGVVTRIDLDTFVQGDFWGGNIVQTIDTLPQQLQAFVDFVNQDEYDPYASLIHSYGFVPALGDWIVINNVIYTKPEVAPATYKNFTDIPQMLNTTRISNLTDFTNEVAATQPDGLYDIYITATYANDIEVLTNFFKLANESLQPIRNASGLIWSFSFQPLTTVIKSHAALTGGNSLGLPESSGNDVMALIAATWSSNVDSLAIEAALHKVIAESNNFAASRGSLKPFTYLNYAYKGQKPIQGYGEEVMASLKAASQKYDPLQIFQKWVPGGFKLDY